MAITFAKKDANGKPLTLNWVRGTRVIDDFQLVDQDSSVPIDLTGITDVIMRIRKTLKSPVLLELRATGVSPLLIVSSPETGEVDIDIPSAVSNTLPNTILLNNKRRGRYNYDVVIERESGEYEAATSGKVVVDSSITNPLDDA